MHVRDADGFLLSVDSGERQGLTWPPEDSTIGDAGPPCRSDRQPSPNVLVRAICKPAAERAPDLRKLLAIGELRQAEVGNLDLSLRGQQDVGALDVTIRVVGYVGSPRLSIVTALIVAAARHITPPRRLGPKARDLSRSEHRA